MPVNFQELCFVLQHQQQHPLSSAYTCTPTLSLLLLTAFLLILWFVFLIFPKMGFAFLIFVLLLDEFSGWREILVLPWYGQITNVILVELIKQFVCSYVKYFMYKCICVTHLLHCCYLESRVKICSLSLTNN